MPMSNHKKPTEILFMALVAGAISGLFGVIEALGLCSTFLIVALFALLGPCQLDVSDDLQ